ncbi:hypothetical protein LWI28_003051, partial [Acer negundo]
ESKILKFLGFMWNPLSWVMEAAAIMAIALANGGGRPPDWQDFVAAALMANLAPKTKVLRDGRWSEQEASILVPGDIISIKLGDIVPADARLLRLPILLIAPTRLDISKKFSLPLGIFALLHCCWNNLGDYHLYPVQHRQYRDGIDNLLVLLIGGIPIAMPTVLSVTMAIGSHRLSQQGAITKRMTAIEEMAGMDVLCSDKTGTLTLNKLTVDINLIEVFAKGVEKDHVMLLAARASRTENQEPLMLLVVGMLADPKEARAGIREIHFFPFNPVDKRTALTYIDSDGSWHRASKGAPEQIIDLCNCKEDVRRKAHAVIDKFAERGLRSLAVARQEVPERTKESSGGPWQFIGLLPLSIHPGMTVQKPSEEPSTLV